MRENLFEQSGAVPLITRPLIALMFLVGAYTAYAPAPVADTSFLEKLGPGVVEKVMSQGQAEVVVYVEPVSYSSRFVTQEYSRMIEAKRNRVIDRVRQSGVTPTVVWHTIPSFAAKVDLQGLEALASHPAVEKVDLDVSGGTGLKQSVPLVGADLVQRLGYTGEGVVIGLLDTGIQTDHPDLKDALLHEHCFCRNSDWSGCCPSGGSEEDGAGSSEDDNGHGTNVAGIMVSRGAVAPVGMAPGAGLVSVKVIDRNNRFNSMTQIISALDWIASNRPEVRVINMSLGTDMLFKNECDGSYAWTMALADVCKRLYSRGTLLFASSMNNGSRDSLASPACISTVVSVGAVYDSDVGRQTVAGCTDEKTGPEVVTCFSNTGPLLDMLAPGAPITSTGRFSRTSTYYGTSQASPHAAGAAALLLQAFPEAGPAEIREAMIRTGVPTTDDKNGLTFPRLDVSAALDYMMQAVQEEETAEAEVRTEMHESLERGDVEQIGDIDSPVELLADAEIHGDSSEPEDTEYLELADLPPEPEADSGDIGEIEGVELHEKDGTARTELEPGIETEGDFLSETPESKDQDDRKGRNWPTNLEESSGCGCGSTGETSENSVYLLILLSACASFIGRLSSRARYNP